MKLISMVDFVFLMRENNEKDNIRRFWSCEKYAKFLKQPLKLEMFVPCDDSEKEKEKVLFKDCSTMQQGENTIVISNDSAIWLTWTKRCIEDLVRINPELTESAIKQMGL